MPYVRPKTFTAGSILPATDLNAISAALEAYTAAIPGTDIVDASLTLAKLSTPKAVVPLVVPLVDNADALSAGGLTTAQPGVSDMGTGGRTFPCRVAYNCTLVAVGTSCRALGGAPRVRLVQNGTSLAATETIFSAGAAQLTSGLSIALLATDTLLVNVFGTAAGDDVAAAHAVLWVKIDLQIA